MLRLKKQMLQLLYNTHKDECLTTHKYKFELKH